jgi:hypothetical protein
MDPFNPPAIVRQVGDLKALAAEINRDHAAGEESTRRGLEHFRAVGEALLKAKKLVGHGQWLAWLKTNVHFSSRQAQRYMNMAEEWGKCDMMSHLWKDPPLFSIDDTEPAGRADVPGDADDTSEVAEVHSSADEDSDPEPAPGKKGASKGSTSGPESDADMGFDGKSRPTKDQDDVEHRSTIPARLQPYFGCVYFFEKAARLASRLANIFQSIEQSPAYRKGFEGRKHRDYSTYIRSAGRAIEAITPRRPCPECGGAYDPSEENDICKVCGDRGYQTAEEVDQ